MSFITVKSFDSDILANIWLGKLQDQGINCFLKNEYNATIITGSPLDEIELCIDDSQLEKTKELIAHFEEDNKQALKCPTCGSLNVQYVLQTTYQKNVFCKIAMWLFGNYGYTRKQVYHCYNCGFEFDEIKPVSNENE